MTAKRFARHRALLGEEGIELLQQATVAVCGAGGLGSTLLTLLARSGVGTIHIYDSGQVDLSDLNRQTLYTAGDVGSAKALRASDLLLALGDGIEIHPHAQRIDDSTSFYGCDLVVDCLDNFKSRFIVDKATYDAGIPFVHAGVYKYFGQVTTVRKGETRPLHELFAGSDVALDSEPEKPMFPAAVVAVASFQAAECLRQLLPVRLHPKGGSTLCGRLLTVDLATYEVSILPFV